MKLLLKVLLPSIFVCNIYAQVTIGEIEYKKEVIKPAEYDSTKDFETHENFIDYNQYIGLQLFLPPFPHEHVRLYSKHFKFIKAADSTKIGNSGSFKNSDFYDSILTFLYKPSNYRSNFNSEAIIYCDPKEVGDKYYTIIDIYDAKKTKQITQNMFKVVFDYDKKNREIINKRDRYLQDAARHHLKNDSTKPLVLKGTAFVENEYYNMHDFDATLVIRSNITNDTLYSFSRSYYGIGIGILVPYFVKQKQLYNGKKFIVYCQYPNRENKMGDERISCNSKWICEITLLKNKDYSLSYILRNEENKTIVLDNKNELTTQLDYNKGTIDATGTISHNGFIEEGAYLKYEKDKKLKKEELLAKRKQEEQLKLAKEKTDKEKNKAYCIKEFGEQQGKIIAEGKVTIGMNSKMCKTAWGEPFKIDTTTTAESVFEMWHYSWKKNLYFENGTLVRIES